MYVICMTKRQKVKMIRNNPDVAAQASRLQLYFARTRYPRHHKVTVCRSVSPLWEMNRG